MNGSNLPGDEEIGGGGGGAAGAGGDGDIDLGQAPPTPMADMPQPAGAGPAGAGAPIYPSVMLSGDEGLSKIPDKGRAHINFHVSSRRAHTPEHGPHKGKKRHEVEMHLHSIRPIRGYKKAPSKSKVSDDEKAMKKLLGDEGEE